MPRNYMLGRHPVCNMAPVAWQALLVYAPYGPWAAGSPPLVLLNPIIALHLRWQGRRCVPPCGSAKAPLLQQIHYFTAEQAVQHIFSSKIIAALNASAKLRRLQKTLHCYTPGK